MSAPETSSSPTTAAVAVTSSVSSLWKAITHRKPLSSLHGDLNLHQTLTMLQLTSIGIGCVIGAGIFSITGVAAAEYAGPGLCLSFFISAIACLFTGITFAELGTAVPAVGSSYTYCYIFLGEAVAYTVGVCLALENLFAASTVAIAFSSAFVQLLEDALGVSLPPSVSSPTFIMDDYDDFMLSPTFSINLVAVLLILGLSVVLSFGASESASMTTAAVFIKVGVLLALIFYGFYYMFANSDVFTANHTPFFPPADPKKFGKYGGFGVLRGAASIFFSYVGFDAICAMSAESVNPKVDIPRALALTLALCTVFYILVTYFLTGLVNYKFLDVASPVTFALRHVGAPKVYLILTDLGAVAGLLSVCAVCLLGQSRIVLAMSLDNFIPRVFGEIDPRFKVPRQSIAWCAFLGCLMAAVFPIAVLGDLVSFGTLVAFIAVQWALIRKRRDFPDMESPFKVPHMSFPYIGIATCVLQLFFLPLPTLRNFAVILTISYAFYFFYRLQHLTTDSLKQIDQDEEDMSETQHKQHEHAVEVVKEENINNHHHEDVKNKNDEGNIEVETK